MAETLPILVAGGGIGGLAAALALAQTGRQVHVLERASAFTTAGAGIQIGPNGVKALQRLGAADLVRANASAPRALCAYRGGSGERLMQMPLGAEIAARCGAPYWTLHRADLLQALAEAVARVPSIALSFGCEAADVDVTQSGSIVVTLADGSEIRGAALIGADGLWSRIRSVVAPDSTPKSSGYAAFRSIVPIDAAGKLETDIVGTWLSPSAHVVHYPVASGRALNIVIIVDAPWVAASWNAPAEQAQVIDATRAFAPRLRQAIEAAPAWHKWSLPQPMTLRSWSKGPITLLGDAAHATLPFFAQGAVMAMEDAVTLQRAVGAHGSDYAAAFSAYHSVRRARVARVQDASVRNGHIFHLSGAMGFARDAVIKFMPPSAMLARFDWLYAYEPPVVRE